MKLKHILLGILVLCSITWVFAGTTGKISGVVRDVNTGAALPGANVLVKGTAMGAVTNMDGEYTILNVPPGAYSLQASIIGYTSMTLTDVRVNIDLTTTQDFKLKEQTLVGDEITVRAERPVVQKDVAGSQMQVTSEQIENLPVATVGEAVGLQAGVGSDLSIRGSSANQALFMVDGVVMRDERDNAPIAKIPLSAVQQISVQAGGFGAEYNNVRSGLVNVVTREGDADSYSASFTFRYKPASQKYFGDGPFDPNSYWLRPYLDDAVCWTGTDNGAWDVYTQDEYPAFKGWNAVSQQYLGDSDPRNDLSPDGCQRLFQWEHRKQGDIKDPDYLYDVGFGGPVPIIGKKLGNLRFFLSSRKERDMYMIQISRPDLVDQSSMLKLAADITPSMKLSINGLYGEQRAVTSNAQGTSIISSPEGIASVTSGKTIAIASRIYTDIYYCPTSRFYSTMSGKLTHMLSPKTYYETQLKYTRSKYFTMPQNYRDLTTQYEVLPGFYRDESPVGFSEDYTTTAYGALIMGGPVSAQRDFSFIQSYSAKFDLVSQVDHRNQVKTGVEIVYDDFDMSFGYFSNSLRESNTWTRIDQSPIRANFYVQDKLEFEGFISTVGVLFDYTAPNSNWYDVSPYDRTFYTMRYRETMDEQYKTKTMKNQLTVSPRLSVSHPITANSKLYFNYGHYRQLPTSERLYRVQRAHTNQIDYIGDPTIPLERTVSYELGYAQALFSNYLFTLSAYYKDITDQPYSVTYQSKDAQVNYSKMTNLSYADIRGFEADLSKTFGRWIVGDINYEYRVETSGHFGYAYQYENPQEQREYESENPVQTKPRPRPRFKAYLDLRSPEDFGPKVLGHNILGGWNLNTIARWTAGNWFTWNPQDITGILYNVQWKDYYNIDLKFSKSFNMGPFDLKAYVDVYNALNFKYYSGYGYEDIYDEQDYYKSLHLPEDVVKNLGYEDYIPGDDRPGDYRKEDVAFQPIEWTKDLTTVAAPIARAIYYEGASKRYMQYVDGQWAQVPQSKMDKIIKDKAYINMPAQTFWTFLNPRQVFFGITLNYNF